MVPTSSLPYHLLHLIITPQCLLISWESPPSCNVLHLLSYSLKIVVLLSSHHSYTLSTGLTFSNTISLNVILRFPSFNLHHFTLGVACSGVQRFLPYLLLIMCQFRSYNHAFAILCRTQLLIHMFPKTFLFHSLYNHLWIIITHTAHDWITLQSCSNVQPPQPFRFVPLHLVFFTYNTPTFLVVH